MLTDDSYPQKSSYSLIIQLILVPTHIHLYSQPLKEFCLILIPYILNIYRNSYYGSQIIYCPSLLKEFENLV